MHISSIRLENIKSYVDAEIDLTPGTNAICGPNGSGKTTLVEAVGYALFGYLPYKQASFVREGMQSGTVRIRLIALDARPYEIVRQVGRAALHYVFDLELKRKIADKTTAVEEWVRQNILNGDGSADPEFLFLNAVGVPQGLMTAIFLLPPAQRKPTFDRLLGIEDYAKASEKLRDTERYLNQRIGEVREEIGRRETETAQIGQYEDGIADYTTRIACTRERLQKVEHELSSTEDELEGLDRLENKARALADTLRVRRQEHAMLELQLESARERKRRATSALALLDASRPGHEAYVRAESDFEDLEPALAERDSLCRTEQEATAALENRSFETKTLSHQLALALAAKQQADALLVPIAELDRLESLLTDAERADDRARDLDSSLAALRIQRSEAQTEFDRIQSLIGALEARQATVPDLTALESHRQDLHDRYTIALDAGTKLESTAKEIIDLQASAARLAASVESRRDVVKGIESLRAMVKCLPDLIAQQRQADADDQQIKIKIQFQELARSELFKNRCPILPVRCPAVDDKSWVSDSLSQTITALRDEQVIVSERHLATHAALVEAENAREQVSELTIAEKELELFERQLAEVRSRLDELKGKELDLRATMVHAGELQKQTLEVTRRIAAGQKLERELAGLPAHREHASSLRRRIASLSSQESEIDLQREPLVLLARSIPDLKGKVEPLRPLRSELDRAASVAAQINAIEEQLTQARKETDSAKRSVDDVRSRLDVFADLDATAAGLKQVLQTNRGDHDAFIRNETEAGSLPDLVEEERELARSLSEAAEQITQSTAEADTVAEAYSAETHAALRSTRDDLIGHKSSLQTEIQVAEELIALADEKISQLRESMTHLDSACRERKRLDQTAANLEFFRQIFKLAGPAITESLVQGVSDTASQVFGDIMDDHALDLRWERDYEIVVRHGSRDRPFVQLSGGEQMSAALAVRLALAKQVSDISVAFFDEPTQNMDGLRRSNLAEQIEKVRGFEQILVISHDDSFEHHTDSVIRLRKERDRTVVESA